LILSGASIHISRDYVRAFRDARADAITGACDEGRLALISMHHRELYRGA
jgi:hypothetical protein